MQKMELFKNKELGLNLQAMSNDDGSISVNLEDAARGLGFTRIANSGNAVVRWGRVKGYLEEFGVSTCGHDDFIPETVFYLLAMKAKNETAKKFQAWVAIEVLPSIRKHGAYMTDKVLEQTLNDPDFMIGLLTELKGEREKRKQLEVVNQQQTQQIAELQPKADYTDKILQSNGLLTVRQIAMDYGMTPQAMNKVLHELGVQYKQSGQWFLYKEHLSSGYTKSSTYVDNYSRPRMSTKWTQKGRLFLYNLLKENGILPLIEREETTDEVAA